MFKAIHRVVVDKDNILPGQEFEKKDFNLKDEEVKRLIDLGAIRKLPEPEATKEIDEPDEDPEEIIEDVEDDDSVEKTAYPLKVNTGKKRK